MSESWLELTIIGFIIVGIAFSVFRGGQANPESTGTLGTKLSSFKSELAGVKGDVAGVKRQIEGVNSELRAIDSRVTEIDRRGATIDDVRGIEKKLDELKSTLSGLDNELSATREAQAAQHADIEHTRRQVDRLYDFIVERGMSK